MVQYFPHLLAFRLFLQARGKCFCWNAVCWVIFSFPFLFWNGVEVKACFSTRMIKRSYDQDSFRFFSYPELFGILRADIATFFRAVIKKSKRYGEEIWGKFSEVKKCYSFWTVLFSECFENILTRTNYFNHKQQNVQTLGKTKKTLLSKVIFRYSFFTQFCQVNFKYDDPLWILLAMRVYC